MMRQPLARPLDPATRSTSRSIGRRSSRGRNYSVFVHLLDENEIEKQAQDKGPAYPGRGNLPTTTLAPGQTWAETWIMPVAPPRMRLLA